MDATDDTGATSSTPTDGGSPPPQAPSHSLGPDAVAILSTEHWSLLSSRSLIWSEAMNRSTVFLSLLSATMVALALLADTNDFGRRTTTLALVLLPIVLLLGVVTHVRLVQINSEEVRTMLAMNRLRNAYLEIAPDLRPYFSTGFHDDERGLAASYLMSGTRRMRPWRQFLQAMATLVATVDAVLAATIVVIAVQAAGASTALTVVAGVLVFLPVWVALVFAQRQALHPLRRIAPRFPSPPEGR